MAVHALRPLLLLLLLASARGTPPMPCPRIVAVSGQGVVTSAPDTASVSTGVVTIADTAQAALSRNNNVTQGLLDTLSEFDVEARDIQTTSFSVSPRFERRDSGETRRIIGYTVRNNLAVVVRDLDNLGLILDALVRAGSNQVSGVRFSISEDSDLRDEARRAAVRDARRRATSLAEEAGARLGRVVLIREQGAAPSSRRAFTALPDMAEVPIAAGELDVAVGVSMEFELADGDPRERAE